MIKEFCRSRRIGGGKSGEGGEKARGEKVRMRRPMGSEELWSIYLLGIVYRDQRGIIRPSRKRLSYDDYMC